MCSWWLPPPILIEVQLVVTEKFMQRLVRYSHNVIQVYEAYPIIIVFCVDRLSPASMINRFKPSTLNPWMLSTLSCEWWAKNCYLVSKETLSFAPENEMTPLLALTKFLLEQSPSLYGHSTPEDPTILMLYSIAKTCCNVKTNSEEQLVDVVNVVCGNNEKLLRRADASLKNIQGCQQTSLVDQAFELRSGGIPDSPNTVIAYAIRPSSTLASTCPYLTAICATNLRYLNAAGKDSMSKSVPGVIQPSSMMPDTTTAIPWMYFTLPCKRWAKK
ncbi:hypothetical protein [Absidia glauca]|uniref:Uncharacterized protein n=1 Tax=Absidia glauca TaxID=4829 RepID=A0A163JVQ8_ABSGL|nr:hypothetical protein [Absidia glauca]